MNTSPARADPHPHAEAVARACHQIAHAITPPSLQALAAQAAMSPYHFHRVFKQLTGLTPKGYAHAARAHRMREALATGSGSVTDAIYAAGFNSNSRFYDGAQAVLGMPARQYRRGAPGQRISFAVADCELGALLVAQTEQGVCAIALGDDPDQLVRDLQDRFAQAELIGDRTAFESHIARVVAFVQAPGVGLDLPLDIQGTAFQQRVWQALREIPIGQTSTYTDIARLIGAPAAVRAVAGACAANPVALAVPCHRVVRQDGALSGYRWGVARKRELLRREGAPAAREDDPLPRERAASLRRSDSAS